MKAFDKTVYTVTVDFVLIPEKQHLLIWFLKEYTPVGIDELASLLNISVQKIIDVLERKDFLSKAEAKKLVRFFCVFCGS